ncbi:MAG TPA: S9 family peptidase [Terriglobales bacterium]|nr:S9 family peptidase [Terriglobales bacterium]
MRHEDDDIFFSRFSSCSLWILFALLMCVLAAREARAQETGRITLEDIVSVPWMGTPVLSPDGKQFALVRDGQIYLLSSDGGWPVLLTTTPGGKSEVCWSPDSRSLTFVSEGSIWIAPVAGGQPKRLTDGAIGPGDPRGATDRSPRWNPAGKWILFQSGRRGKNELFVVSEDGQTKNFLVSTELYQGRDQLGDFTADQTDGLAVDRFEPDPTWSPDGASLVYTERSREYFSGKLKLIHFDSSTGQTAGTPIELYEAKPDRGGAWAINKVAWSPDGKTLAFTLQDSGWDKVYLLPEKGGPPKQLTQGESEDAAPVYAPDGKALAILSNRNHPEEERIWIVPLNGSQPRQLTDLGPGVEGSPQWSPDGKRIYFIRSSPLESANLYAVSIANDSPPRALTKSLPLDFDAAQFAPPEVTHFKGKDGLDLTGILYRPRAVKSGVRYPAVLWIHGGPEGQDTLSFSAWSLFLTQEGYVVFRPNYRGSSGYGEKFRNLNVEDSGGGEVQDVAAAVQYLVDQGIADPKRIAIGGGSHGGTMVNFAVTKLPDTFAAAISLFGVSDRATFLERTNRNSAIRWETKMGGTPEQKPAVYHQANILLDVPKIKTPLLIMHGEEDPQVPPYESAQLVTALKKEGKIFFYYTYAHEGHGFTDREHWLDALRKEQIFLRKYLKPSYGQSSTSVDDLFVPQE